MSNSRRPGIIVPAGKDRRYSLSVEDAAKRVSDGMNLFAATGDFDTLFRSFVAFKLEDGSTDYVLYDSREDAIRVTRNGPPVMVLSTREAPGGMPVKEALAVLTYHRALHDAGIDQNRAMIIPLERDQVGRQLRQIIAANGHNPERYRR